MSAQRYMNEKERLAVFALYSAYNIVKNACEPLKGRMARDPYSMRGLKASVAHLERALNAILGTLDRHEMVYISRNSKDYETIVRPIQIVKDPTWMWVKTDDLKVLMDFAKKGECSICLKDRQQQATCPLREILGILDNEPEAKFDCGFKGGE